MKKLICTVLTVIMITSLLVIPGNAYQMAHLQYKNPIGTVLYDFYLWNEDPVNPSTSEPYKLHVDMDNTASYYSFSVAFASIRRYDYSQNQYVDEEKDAVLGELTTNHMMWFWNVSAISYGIGDSVTDDYTDSTGRDTVKNVYARANVVTGDINGSTYTYYTAYPSSGGPDPRVYFSYDFTSTYSTRWN